MSTIAVVGATGYVGGHIVAEAVSRGHPVVAVSRSAPPDDRHGVTVRAGSIEDSELISDLAERADVIAVAVRGAAGGRPFLPAQFPGLLETVGTKARLGVAGGAGVLLVDEGGPRLMDTPQFPELAKLEAGAMAAVLDVLRASRTGTDWFFLSPGATFGRQVPGERTGTYRVGHDVLLRDDHANSAISGADFAIAFIDEIEKPAHHRQSFTVAY
jgi:uncharacterized protein